MDMQQAIYARHSVRAFSSTFLSMDTLDLLQKEVESCNKNGGLHIQLITGDPNTFHRKNIKYGHFKNIANYLALIGKKDEDQIEQKIGYYGEHLALFAQTQGLNSCWIGLTTKHMLKKVKVAEDEKIYCVIVLGYGITQGKARKKKAPEKICKEYHDMPDWFQKGVQLACLAPSAMNQQKFSFEFLNSKVIAKPGFGFFTKIDLGIAQYHFEVGAGSHNINWSD